MQTSPFLDEIRAEARKEARAEGLAQGRAEGWLEGVRGVLIRQGRRLFGKAPTKKQQQKLEAVTDRGQLEALAGRLLQVTSWAELLQGLP